MARPRIVRTASGGEISLKNCTPEEYEKIKSTLDGEQSVATENSDPFTSEAKKDLPSVGLSTARGSDGKLYVVILKYDLDTGEAFVESKEECKNPVALVNKFKLYALKHKLVV